MECLPEIAVDILFDSDDEKRRDDRRARRAKREQSKIPDSFVPCRREMNWFLARETSNVTPDIADHPDKYVQAEINYESDRAALQAKSRGDYHFIVKGDYSSALSSYLEAQATASPGNGVLHRELGEAVPLCLIKLGDDNKAKELLMERLEKTGNYDHRNSLMYCMLRHFKPDMLPLTEIIHLLPLQRDEPAIWALFVKYFEPGSDRYLTCVYSIIRLCNWLCKYTSAERLDYYRTLGAEFGAIADAIDAPVERQIELKVKVKSLWDDHEKLKEWFLT